MHELRTHALMYKALKALPGDWMALPYPSQKRFSSLAGNRTPRVGVEIQVFSVALQGARMSWWASATMSSGPSPSGGGPSTRTSGACSCPCVLTVLGVIPVLILGQPSMAAARHPVHGPFSAQLKGALLLQAGGGHGQ